MPRVSIGVPVYNGASLIYEALDCIASQSFNDIEVIISDNGSTDGTSEICADFAAKDSRFKHIRHDTTMDVMLNLRLSAIKQNHRCSCGALMTIYRHGTTLKSW